MLGVDGRFLKVLRPIPDASEIHPRRVEPAIPSENDLDPPV